MYFDVVILALIIMGMLAGFNKGVVFLLLGKVGLFFSLLIALQYCATFAPYFSGVVQEPVLQLFMSFIVVLLLTKTLFHISGNWIVRTLNELNLRYVDKFLGGAAGTAQVTIVILAAFYFVGVHFKDTGLYKNSNLYPYLVEYSQRTPQMWNYVTKEVLPTSIPKEVQEILNSDKQNDPTSLGKPLQNNNNLQNNADGDISLDEISIVYDAAFSDK